ncbi:DMT family transporter [Castellaniella ginsengisoli]
MQSLWMLLACAMFAMMGAFVKVAADFGATLPEIVLFRGIPSVLLLYFWARSTRRTIRPSSWRLHIWRNLSGITSMWLGFFALSHLSLPTAVSLNYTAPLFIAGWMLCFGGAQRDPVRVLAVLAGFLGVLGVLRPSIQHDQWLAALMGLGAGGLAAIAMMQIRQLGQVGEPEWRTVLLFSLGVCASGLGGIALQGWRTSDPLALLALVGLGLAGLVGQLAMTRAFGLGSTLLTAALQYVTIIFAALIGVLFWGDRPAPLAWAGMALIIGSGLLSVWRTYTEARALRGDGHAAPPESPGISTKEVTPS